MADVEAAVGLGNQVDQRLDRPSLTRRELASRLHSALVCILSCAAFRAVLPGITSTPGPTEVAHQTALALSLQHRPADSTSRGFSSLLDIYTGLHNGTLQAPKVGTLVALEFVLATMASVAWITEEERLQSRHKLLMLAGICSLAVVAGSFASQHDITWDLITRLSLSAGINLWAYVYGQSIETEGKKQRTRLANATGMLVLTDLTGGASVSTAGSATQAMQVSMSKVLTGHMRTIPGGLLEELVNAAKG